jgi:hypothetical protein
MVAQATCVEADGHAVNRQARRMHVAADDRLHRQPVAESIHRPSQSRGRHGSTPLSTLGRNGRSMATGMHDAHPWHSHTAGRMNRTGHSVPENSGGVARARPDVDHAVSRCIGSGVGAGIRPCIRRYMDTELGDRIQTPGLADIGRLAGVSRAPLAEDVCQCNVGDPRGIPRSVERDAVDRGMERWRLVCQVVGQSLHRHQDDGRGCDEADSARRHRGCVADSSSRCTGHG